MIKLQLRNTITILLLKALTNMNKKVNKRFIKPIVLCLLLFIIPYIGIKIYFSPFKTEEEMQVKPIYKAAMNGISGFKITSVLIEKEAHTVLYYLKLKNRTASQSFTEQEMESINQAVEQLIDYLNTEDNLNYLYTAYST